MSWLDGAFDWDEAHLIASRNPMSLLERAVVEGAQKGAYIKGLVGNFLCRAYRDPTVVERELDGYGVFAGLVGVRGPYLGINRSETDIGSVKETFREIATGVGIPAYYGGSAVESSATYDLFGRLPGEHQEIRRWERIA